MIRLLETSRNAIAVKTYCVKSEYYKLHSIVNLPRDISVPYEYYNGPVKKFKVYLKC